MNATQDRAFDLVLYGASGFVGRQCVESIAKRAPPGVPRWAMAGPNRITLEAVKAEAGAEVEVLTADSHDQASVDRVVADTRVLAKRHG